MVIGLVFVSGCVQEQGNQDQQNLMQSSCGDGICQSGEASSCPDDCATGCRDECSRNGMKQCDGNGYKTCGNYDSDSCMEWGSVTACGSGKTCNNGKCVTDNSPGTGETAGYAVVAKTGDSFYDVAVYFAGKKNAELVTYTNNFDEAIHRLSEIHPKYVALVISPQELTPDFVDLVDNKMREIDNDPYYDAAFGIITSFTVDEAYDYIDRLLVYSPKTTIDEYVIGGCVGNPSKLEGVKSTVRCNQLGDMGIGICSDEDVVTPDNLNTEIRDKDLIRFNLHGTPESMEVGTDFSLRGDSSLGLFINVMDPNNLCNMDDPVCDKGKKTSITLANSIVVADSCMTARINGVPSNVKKEFGDMDNPGIVDKSIVLAALKSGAVAYIGATHVSVLGMSPTNAVFESMIHDISVGEAIKNFKNRLMYNKIAIRDSIYENNGFGSTSMWDGEYPLNDKKTMEFIDFEAQNWVLFGDPSIEVIDREYENKHTSIKDLEINGNEIKLNVNFGTVENIEEMSGAGNGGRYTHTLYSEVKFVEIGQKIIEFTSEPLLKTYLINIPKDRSKNKITVTSVGLDPEHEKAFTGSTTLIQNLGDEIMISIPAVLSKGFSEDFEFNIRIE